MQISNVPGACVPPLTKEIKASIPRNSHSFFLENCGKPFPLEHSKKAVAEIEELCNILQHEGVVVRRPDPVDFTKVRLSAVRDSKPIRLRPRG